MMKKFQGKVALITGGSKGIGGAIAIDLAAEGCNIALTYFRDKKSAEKIKKTVTELGSDCLIIKSNLASYEDVIRTVKDTSKKFNKIDFLINNAATGVNVKADQLTIKHWDWVINTNSRAPWLMSIEVSKIMADGGSIVNISSLGSQKVLSNYFSVGVSKAALEAITRYLSVELAPKNIKVNAISPGLIKTAALDSFPDTSDWKIMANKDTPAGRPLKVRDVTDLVKFLCSEDSTMIRGQTIIIDGGQSLVG
ncbi:MAG: enoyl-[acyl-carrier-protein] reductase FabL [Actinobacteria bacterium]|jgi:enoyl-[acyl-carrier protein] reductase III|nr:enoyl-[acyl-carrier-protein] reductase FabL [Actinomycetota bacterium]|tara:strand:+ start:2984 stop:3739 length:756 start_codon:yes stop_codon:yes gene_type:complete